MKPDEGCVNDVASTMDDLTDQLISHGLGSQGNIFRHGDGRQASLSAFSFAKYHGLNLLKYHTRYIGGLFTVNPCTNFDVHRVRLEMSDVIEYSNN